MTSTPAGSRVAPADEGFHPENDDQLWSESCYLDAISDDGDTGFYVRLGDTRNLGVSLMSVVIARPGQPSIILSDDQAPAPVLDGDRWTVSAADYTATFEIREALQEFSVGFSGTARRYGDEGAILRGEAGEPVPVAAELTWQTDGIDYQWPSAADRYEIPCRVTGTVTVDGMTEEFAGNGQRDHSWGSRDWWGVMWMWNALWLDDGSRIHSTVIRDIPFAAGYCQRDGELTEITHGEATQTYGGDGRIPEASFTLPEADLEVTVTPLAYGNLLLRSPDGKIGHFIRAMSDFHTSDGRTGKGWIEWEFVPDGAGGYR